ncbi:MAG: AAA family ATPase [Verrucomicrobiaceae bacterium]|nr:AAA family ATPase [Verrucomicrobiaceae bacterium]
MTRHFLHSISLDRRSVPDWDEHPFSVPAIQRLETLKLHPKVTFFVGENGSGKSTLLEAIAEKLGFRFSGGSRVESMFKHEYHSPLTPRLTLSRTSNRPMDGFFLRAESFHNWATELDELEATPHCGGVLGSYGGKSLHAQSHGESFLNLLTQRIDGHGIYLFDEPEAALSPQRQLSMLVRLHDLVDEFSQFIIATHSPLIMAYPDAWIYQFGPDGIERIAYEDTEHFQITRSFMRDPKVMLKRLLRREGELDFAD